MLGAGGLLLKDPVLAGGTNASDPMPRVPCLRKSRRLIRLMCSPHSISRFLGSGYWLLVTGLDSGFWILDSGFWILDSGFWILDWILEIWILANCFSASQFSIPGDYVSFLDSGFGINSRTARQGRQEKEVTTKCEKHFLGLTTDYPDEHR